MRDPQMTTVIGLLSFGFFGFALAVPDYGSFSKIKAQPEARMQMDGLLAALGTPGNRPTCMHEGRWYYERSAIPTVDSCINCKCENGTVRCNMTLCPMYPNIQDGCQLQHEEGSCCPQLVCNENVAKQLSSVPEIHDATLLGCTYNDFEFGLGDFIPTSDPCQACYCIHNRTQCVHQNCALPESAREGCRPVYHHGICCPIRYDCSEALSSPPTQRPSLTSEGCAVNNRLYDEGEAIASGRPCEHCYCMKGEMICAMQKCDTPMAGCVPVIKDGQCCPERFECPNLNTTPAPWNDTGAVFADPAGSAPTTTKRKLSLNITIETKNFPRQESKFSSTTRALDEDNDLLSDLQRTTAPTVTTTLAIAPSDNTIPTVTPPAAQFGFLSIHRPNAAMTMRVNGSQYQSTNRRFSPQPTPGSATQSWLSPDFSSNPDVLQYIINGSDKIAPVSASEILNSADTLGTRLNLTIPGTAPSAGNQVIILTQAPPAPLSNEIASDTTHILLPSATERIPTKTVGGSTSLIMTSSSDIPLNSKINITAGGSLSIPGPGKSAIRSPVMLPPVDPSTSELFEGFIQAPAKPRSPAPATMVATDPEVSGEVEGAASFSSPAQQKFGSQFPAGAHLTEVGLALDPTGNDQLEGTLMLNKPTRSDKLPPADASFNMKPFDPTSNSEVEGWLNRTPTTQTDLRANTVTSADQKNIINNAIPVDPTSPSEVEGTTKIITAVDKKNTVTSADQTKTINNAIPVDPTSPSDLEGTTKTAAAETDKKITITPGNPLDPSTPSEVEGAIRFSGLDVSQNVKISPAASARPIDPSMSNEIEGSLVVSNPSDQIAITQPPATTFSTVITTTVMPNIVADQTVRKGQSQMPLDPTPADSSQIEGTWTRKAAATADHPVITAQLIPLDPTQAAEVEGSVNMTEASKTVPPTSPAQIALHPLTPLDPTQSTEIEGTLSTLPVIRPSSTAALGDPVDPTSATGIEGALSTLPAIRPAAPGSLHPTDPISADQFEGSLSLNAPAQLPMINLTRSGAGMGDGLTTVPPVSITTVSTASTTTRSSQAEVKKPVETAAKTAVVLTPLDPSSGNEVEGSLSWVNPVKKVAEGVLHPTDPLGDDGLEGALAMKPANNNNKNSLSPETPANYTVVDAPRNPVKNLLPLEPGSDDTAEGSWQAVQRTQSPVILNTSPVQSTTTSLPEIVVRGQITTKNLNPSRQSPSTTSTTQRSIELPAAAVVSGDVGSSPIPTQPPATTLAVNNKVNASIPANLMMSMQATTTKRKNVISANQIVNPAGEKDDSKIVILPADPSMEDDYEGALSQGAKPFKWASQSPLDPVPTDNVDGVLERPNEVTNSDTQTPSWRGTTTRTPWTLYSAQNNDSTVSRWVIQTTNSQFSSGMRNVTWLPNSPADGIRSATAATTSPSTTSTTFSMTSTSARPIFATLSTTPSTTTVIRASSSISSTESNAAGASDIPSVLQPGDINRLNSMIIKENRRATTVAAVTGQSGDLITTSAPVWAGMFGSQPSPTDSNGSIPVVPAFESGAPLTGIYENGCYYDGVYYRNYQSVPTSDLVDPCMVRLCRNGVVLGPSEQRCPPPIDGCFSTSIPGVCCPVYLCPNYLERNETSYTLTAASGDTLNTEKTKLALAKFCRVGPRFLALNERVVHVMGVQCQTCTCKAKGIVCEPGCVQGILITTEMPPVIAPRRFPTLPTTPATTLPPTPAPVTEPAGSRSCLIHQKHFSHGEEVSFNDPCHMCTCMDGLVICKINRQGCRNARLLSETETFF